MQVFWYYGCYFLINGPFEGLSKTLNIYNIKNKMMQLWDKGIKHNIIGGSAA